jgi:uncharacterized protein YabE (DUF348 family)
MSNVNRRVAGVLAGLVAAGVLFTGGQAFATPASATVTASGHAEAGATLSGSVTAILGGALTIKTDAGASVTVKLTSSTRIEGHLSLKASVTVHTVKINGELCASLIVLG